MKSSNKGILIAATVLALLLVAAGITWAQSDTAAQKDPNAYLWGQINHAKDPNNLTALEQAHVPGIDIAGPVTAGQPVKVTVKVGVGHMHPSTHDHFIQWIELYNKDMLLGRVDLSPATSQPEATFTVVLDNSTTLKARQNCNLHGTWESSKNVKVT